jgi:serine/threonine-protein kinase
VHTNGYTVKGPPAVEPAAPAGAFQPGTLLRDTYRIVGRLAVGGMGEIYEATHERLAGRLAVKALHRDLVRNEEAFVHFAREGLVMSGLQHPHIAQVFDFDVSPDGTPYLVLEYLAGETLQSLLDREGPLPVPRVSTIVRQIASALESAHQRGVVHRDLKPENVMLVPQQAHAAFVKVLDFGISKVDWSSRSTRESVRMGTPAYMSPEQAQGDLDAIDHLSDQFSLAALTHALLTGHPPFRAADPVAVLYQLVHETAPPLPASFGGLAAVIGRGLAKLPSERYPDVLAFSRALDEAATALERPTAAPSWLPEARRPPVREAADIFAFRRSRAASPAPVPEPPPLEGWARRSEDGEAARCFDRGLALVAEKEYAEGLRQWERALELDPENRTYRSNVRRLRERLSREQQCQGRKRS